jgi:hypothetical protein
MFFNWRALRFICILRFTRWTTSMSNSTRIWIVFMSWDEYHEMRLFVNRSIELSCWDLLLISWFVRWEFEHDRWIDEFDWSKISWDYRASLLDLRETMRWLNVTYSCSKWKRNMILFLKIIVSIIKQWIHWIWKTFFYWIFLSNELLVWFFEFSLIVNLLIRSFEMKTSLRVRIWDEKTSWKSRLSFTIVNIFFHARNHASFMRKMLVLRIIHREDNHFDRFKIQIEFLCDFFWNSSKMIVFHEWKML